MFCSNCGKEIPDGSKFCQECGSKIEIESSENDIIPSDEKKLEKADQIGGSAEIGDLPVAEDVNAEISECENNEVLENDKSESSEQEISENCCNIENNLQDEKQNVCKDNDKISEDLESSAVLNDYNLGGVDSKNENLQDISEENTTETAVEKETKTLTNSDNGVVVLKSEESYSGEQKAAKSTKSKKIGIGFRILAAFICIILFISVFSTSLYGAFRSWILSDSLQTAIYEIDISDIKINGKDISQIIYENCSEDTINKYNLSEYDIDRLLKKIDTQEAVNVIVMPYLDYFSGKSAQFPEISAQDIVGIIESNEDVIEEVLDRRLDDDDYDYIKNEAEMAFAGLSEQSFKEYSGVAPRFARMFAEWYLYAAMIFVCVILGILVWLANKRRIARTLGDIGGVMITVAVFLLIVLGFIVVVPVVLNIPDVIISYTNSLRDCIAVRALVFAAAGFLSCMIYWIYSFVERKKNNA
jgi:hypothetical protein